jgi:hypothetical protein
MAPFKSDQISIDPMGVSSPPDGGEDEERQ